MGKYNWRKHKQRNIKWPEAHRSAIYDFSASDNQFNFVSCIRCYMPEVSTHMFAPGNTTTGSSYILLPAIQNFPDTNMVRSMPVNDFLHMQN